MARGPQGKVRAEKQVAKQNGKPVFWRLLQFKKLKADYYWVPAERKPKGWEGPPFGVVFYVRIFFHRLFL